jgi:TonB family protein
MIKQFLLRPILRSLWINGAIVLFLTVGVGAAHAGYWAQLHDSAEMNWNPPPKKLTRIKIRVSCNRFGKVRVIRVIESSGSAAVDAMSLRAIRHAKAPPLPPDWSGEVQGTVTLETDSSGEVLDVHHKHRPTIPGLGDVAEVHHAITRNWSPPGGKAIRVQVQVAWKRSGQLRLLKILQGNGDKLVNDSVQSAIRAAKAPPLPFWFKHNEVVVCETLRTDANGKPLSFWTLIKIEGLVKQP